MADEGNTGSAVALGVFLVKGQRRLMQDVIDQLAAHNGDQRLGLLVQRQAIKEAFQLALAYLFDPSSQVGYCGSRF
jgi:hypothetical protein